MTDESPAPPQSERTATSNYSTETDSDQSVDHTQRVGVLSPHNSKETKAILNAVRDLGHEPIWIRDENVTSWIENGSMQITPEVDVVVNRMLLTKSDQQLEDLQLAILYEETTPVLNSPQAVQSTLHKYQAGVQLAAAGLPVPDAYFGRSPRTLDKWQRHLSGPAAHKRTIGTNGHQMFRVSSKDIINPDISKNQSFMQEFLDSDDERPSDVRVYVVGDRIVGAMRRRAPEGDWRTNVALGGEVEDVTDELSQNPRHLAKKATAVLDLDFTGVDLMPVEDEWYILEVNTTAGFKGLFSATGISAAPHIARLAIERAGGDVTDSRVTEVESTLDDTVPACKPPLIEESADDKVLGYTTRIRISGRDDAESAVTKADTGAKRTSIDTELAGRIGAGPLVGTTQVRSSTKSGTETRPLVDVNLRLNGGWRTVRASVADRSEMTYPVLLGRDVLEDYILDIGQRVEE